MKTFMQTLDGEMFEIPEYFTNAYTGTIQYHCDGTFVYYCHPSIYGSIGRFDKEQFTKDKLYKVGLKPSPSSLEAWNEAVNEQIELIRKHI